MKRTIVLAGVLATMGLAAHWAWTQSAVLALRFDPVFRLVSVADELFVLRPGEKPALDPKTGDEFWPPARNNRAYTYGTRIKTGKPSNGIIKFSRRSEAEIGANSLLTVDQDKEDARKKIVVLEKGSLKLRMEKGIEGNGNSVTVVTPSAHCLAAEMSSVDIEVRQEGDKTITDIAVKDGNVSIFNPDLFRMYFSAIEKGGQLTVRLSGSPDGNFIDLIGVHGTFGVKVKNPPRDDGPPEDAPVTSFGGGSFDMPSEEEEIFEGLPREDGYRIYKVTPGFTINFSKRILMPGNVLAVVILPIDASGNILKDKAIDYKEGAPEPPPLHKEGIGPDLLLPGPDEKQDKKDDVPAPIDLGDLGFDF